MNKSINLNDENIKNGVKILENTFLDINYNLFGQEYKRLEIKRPNYSDVNSENIDEILKYQTFTTTSANIVNNVNQINHWSTAALSSLAMCALLGIALKPPIEEMKERIKEFNLLKDMNNTLNLLTTTFKEIVIFKNYVLALKEIYKVKYTENLISYMDVIENKMIKNFKDVNKHGSKVNDLLGDEYVGKFKLNDDYFTGYDKILEELKDLEFLDQSYPYIVNEFFIYFNLEFKKGKPYRCDNE